MRNSKIDSIQAVSHTYVGSRNALMYLFDKFEEKGTLDVEDFTKAEEMSRAYYDYAVDIILVVPRSNRGYRNLVVQDYPSKEEA